MLKKFILISLICGLVVTLTPALSISDVPPFDSYKSSGLQTSDVAIKATDGYLGAVLIITNGTDDVTLILYDDPDSAHGTVLWRAKVAGGDNYGGVVFYLPIRFGTGCWADIEGTSPNYIVYYR